MAVALTLVGGFAATAARADDTDVRDDDEAPRWSGLLGLGAVWLAGNSREIVVTGNALVGYAGDAWAVDLEADGVYGRSRPAGLGWQTTAAMAEGQLRGERTLAPAWAVFGYVGAKTDRPSSIALRLQGELGVLYTAIDVKDPADDDDDARVLVKLGVGAHYEYDWRHQYEPVDADEPNASLLSPGVGWLVRARVSHRARVLHHTEVFPKVWGDARVRLDSKTKLYTDVTDRLTLATYYKLEIDTDPAPDRDSFNSTLTFGAELAL